MGFHNLETVTLSKIRYLTEPDESKNHISAGLSERDIAAPLQRVEAPLQGKWVG